MKDPVLSPLIGHHAPQPNPVREGALTLSYHLKAPADRVTLSVFNRVHQEVLTCDGPTRMGENSLLLDVRELPLGFYSYVIEGIAGDLTHYKKGHFIVFKDEVIPEPDPLPKGFMGPK